MTASVTEPNLYVSIGNSLAEFLARPRPKRRRASARKVHRQLQEQGFLAARPRVIAMMRRLYGRSCNAIGMASVLDRTIWFLSTQEARTNRSWHHLVVGEKDSTAAHALVAICDHTVSRQTLSRYLDQFVNVGLLRVKVEYRFRLGRRREHRLYSVSPSFLAILNNEPEVSEVNTVWGAFFVELNSSCSCAHPEHSCAKPLALYSSIAMQENSGHLPRNGQIPGNAFGLSLPALETDASTALRAPFFLETTEQRSSEDEVGVQPSEVGRPGPQRGIPASIAPLPVTPRTTPGPAPEGVTSPVDVLMVLAGPARPTDSRQGDLATRETQAQPDPSSLESGRLPDTTRLAGPATSETDGQGGGPAAPRDEFLDALNGADSVLQEVLSPHPDLDAQLAAFEALQMPAQPQGLRAQVPQGLREHAEFACKQGVWRFPAVEGLLDRPAAPGSFRQTFEELERHFKDVGDTKMARMLNSFGYQLGTLLAEPPNKSTAWLRQDRWTRLGREEVVLAVEMLPRLHVKGDLKTTLALLLDVLCGAKERDGEAQKTTKQAQRPADTGHRPVDNGQLARVEEAAAREVEARREALLAAAPEQQWEGSRATLRILTRGVIDETTFNRLEERCRAGALSAVRLVQQLTSLGRQRERVQEHLAPLLG